jgi:hypothetical protein
MGVEDPDPLEVPTGEALFEVDLGPSGVAVLDEGAHLVPLGIVGGEAFERATGEGNEAGELAGFVLRDLGLEFRGAMALRPVQGADRTEEEGEHRAEEDDEPGFEFHRGQALASTSVCAGRD